MFCADIRNRLDRYISGELAPAVKAEIDSHLQSCEECRHSLNRLTQLSDMLKNVGTPRIPEGFADRVTAQGASRKTRQAAEVSFNPLYWWKKAAVPMRVAVAAILIIGLLAGFSMARSVFRVPMTEPTIQTSSESDPIAQYNIDYLSDAPTGSLAGSYLDMISNSNREE